MIEKNPDTVGGQRRVTGPPDVQQVSHGLRLSWVLATQEGERLGGGRTLLGREQQSHERGDHAWNIRGKVSRSTGKGLSQQAGKGQLRRAPRSERGVGTEDVKQWGHTLGAQAP